MIHGRPFMVELFAGAMSWSRPWCEMGGLALGFDICHESYHGDPPRGATLVLQDVLTLDGAQFRDADLICASPPCQEFSYMAMPWSRGKQIAAALRGQGAFPEPYQGSRTIADLTRLFDACFRIQREASEAAGRHIPMIVENVRGAIPWVGKSAWNYGSFHLWGDVPALMPFSRSWFAIANNTKSGHSCNPVNYPDRYVQHLNTGAHEVGIKSGNSWFGDYQAQKEARQQSIKNGGDWFSSGVGCGLQRHFSSRSEARKAASAMIARIPAPLAAWIAQTYFPREDVRSA